MTAETKPTFTPEQAELILKADRMAVPARAKKILEKVARKEPLSERERGQIEGMLIRKKFGHRRTSDGKSSEVEVSLDVVARRRRVLEMRYRYPPLTIREIAKEIGTDKDTVLADIEELRKEFREYIKTDCPEALGELVAQYEHLYALNMSLANAYSSPNAKAAFTRNAVACLHAKAQLLGDTGKIPLAPKKTEHSGPGGGPIPIELPPELTVEQKIALIMGGREEVPPAPEPEKPAAVATAPA